MRISRTMLAMGALVPSWTAGAAAQDAPALQIVHAPPACLKPGAPAAIRARIQPISEVLRARVLFRTDPLAEPHAVVMAQDGQDFVGALPAALPTLAEATYWIEAANPALVETASDEFTVPVQEACARMARAKKEPVVTAPPGAPPVPQGFDPGETPIAALPGKPSKVGVFGMGPATSLLVALGVGGGAVALAASQAGDGNPPTPVEGPQETPGVQLLDATPAPGTTTRAGPGGMSLQVRIVVPEEMAGGLTALLLSPAGAVCATTPQFYVQLRAYRGLNMSLMGINNTGACGAGYEVASVRVQVVSLASGRVLFSSGTPEVPDLALRFIVTP